MTEPTAAPSPPSKLGFGGALIGGIGGIASGIINAIQSRQNTNRTIKANREQADLAYNRDVEMWNKGNMYNSPQAQMDRLKSAGLNPNLVYGSGAVAGQAAGQLPKYNAPTQDYSHNLPVDIRTSVDAISRFQDFALKNGQIDNLNAQRHAIEAETEIKKLREMKMQKENEFLTEYLTNRNKGQTIEQTLKGQQTTASQAKEALDRQRQGLLTEEIFQSRFKTENQEELFKSQLDALKAGTQLKTQEFGQRQKLNPGQILKQAAEINALQAGTRYTNTRNLGSSLQNLITSGSFSAQLEKQSIQNQLTRQKTETEKLETEYFLAKAFGALGLNFIKGIGRQGLPKTPDIMKPKPINPAPKWQNIAPKGQPPKWGMR